MVGEIKQKSANAEASLTARLTGRAVTKVGVSQADTKVGLSDQAIQYGMVVA
ncbi:unknown [Acholeplasma sp. CAG:878]|nr:unknown [Acholeplasma sp. CAG:878]